MAVSTNGGYSPCMVCTEKSRYQRYEGSPTLHILNHKNYPKSTINGLGYPSLNRYPKQRSENHRSHEVVSTIIRIQRPQKGTHRWPITSGEQPKIVEGVWWKLCEDSELFNKAIIFWEVCDFEQQTASDATSRSLSRSMPSSDLNHWQQKPARGAEMEKLYGKSSVPSWLTRFPWCLSWLASWSCL